MGMPSWQNQSCQQTGIPSSWLGRILRVRLKTTYPLSRPSLRTGAVVTSRLR